MLKTSEIHLRERARWTCARDRLDSALPALGIHMVANNYRLGKCRRYSVDTYYLPRQFDAQKIITGGKHPNQQLWDEVLAESMDYD